MVARVFSSPRNELFSFKQFIAIFFFMTNLINDTETLRQLLLAASNVKGIARETGLSYSWLMQFRHGKIENPTIRSLQVISGYFKQKQAAA